MNVHLNWIQLNKIFERKVLLNRMDINALKQLTGSISAIPGLNFDFNKDTLNFILLGSNLVMMICLCIMCSLWMKSKNKYRKYDNKVIMYDSSDD